MERLVTQFCSKKINEKEYGNRWKELRKYTSSKIETKFLIKNTKPETFAVHPSWTKGKNLPLTSFVRKRIKIQIRREEEQERKNLQRLKVNFQRRFAYDLMMVNLLDYEIRSRERLGLKLLNKIRRKKKAQRMIKVKWLEMVLQI